MTNRMGDIRPANGPAYHGSQPSPDDMLQGLIDHVARLERRCSRQNATIHQLRHEARLSYRAYRELEVKLIEADLRAANAEHFVKHLADVVKGM